MPRLNLFAFLLAISATAVAAPAETVVRNAKVITEDASHDVAQAFAVTADRFVAVGRDRDILRYVGPQTRILDAGGKMVLPGLVDAHIHPTNGLYYGDSCDLRSEPLDLAALTERIRQCIIRLHPKRGE